MDFKISDVINLKTIHVVADDSRSAMQQIMDEHPGGSLVLKATAKGAKWRYCIGAQIFELTAEDLN